MSRFFVAVAAFLVPALALLGCGGGDRTPSDAGPVAYYGDFFFRGAHPLSLMVFSGGRIYGFYQSDYSAPQFPTYVYQGFFVASSVPGGGSVDLYRGHDFNFDRKQADPIDVTLSNQSENQIFGVIASQGGAEDSYFGSYASISNEPTQLTDLPGTYAGQFRSLRESSTLKATLDVSGTLSAETSGGCRIAGKLTARPIGNLYDAEVALSGSCAGQFGEFRGPAFQSLVTRNVYAMLTNEQLEDGVFLHLFDNR